MDADDIADFIEELTESFERQTVNGWPAWFTFPLPETDAQRTAFDLFCAQIEKTTGLQVRPRMTGNA